MKTKNWNEITNDDRIGRSFTYQLNYRMQSNEKKNTYIHKVIYKYAEAHMEVKNIIRRLHNSLKQNDHKSGCVMHAD